MSKLTKIYGKSYIEYEAEVERFTNEIKKLNNNKPYIETIFPNPYSLYNANLKILSENLDINNIYKEILSHNYFHNDNSIINPKEQYNNDSLPDNIYDLIKDYKEKWNDKDLKIFDSMLINGDTQYINVDPGGGNKKSNRCNNKKTNSKKYRKYRRKSHKKSHKKSHRKYNK